MTFEETFAFNPKNAPAEELAQTKSPAARSRKPGVYGDGLVVLLGRSFNRKWLEDWPEFNERLEPFAYVALGNVFCWDLKKKVVQFIDVQLGLMDDVADSIDHLLDEVLVRQDVIDQVLQRSFIEQIRSFHGPLAYGQCYIATPWQMFGGGIDPKRFDRGDLDVYLSLIGQTHFSE